jgi:mono/diheme cytochrome c family protein
MDHRPRRHRRMLACNDPIEAIVMRSMRSACVVAAAMCVAPFLALAQPLSGDAGSGRQIVTAQCSSCHRVEPMRLSERAGVAEADKDGPPSFQSIADLPSTTGLALNVFLHSNHRKMPNLVLSSADSNDVIAYILGLKKQ